MCIHRLTAGFATSSLPFFLCGERSVVLFIFWWARNICILASYKMVSANSVYTSEHFLLHRYMQWHRTGSYIARYLICLQPEEHCNNNGRHSLSREKDKNMHTSNKTKVLQALYLTSRLLSIEIILNQSICSILFSSTASVIQEDNSFECQLWKFFFYLYAFVQRGRDCILFSLLFNGKNKPCSN